MIFVDHVLYLSDIVELVLILTLGLISQIIVGSVLTGVVVLPDRERVKTFEAVRTVTAGT